jgi:hypothetical protein
MSESGWDIGNGTGVVGEPTGPEMGLWEHQQDRKWAVVEPKAKLGCVSTNRTGNGDVGEPLDRNWAGGEPI